jgi:hypothetical protein
MPAIRDLHRIWQAFGCRFAIPAAAIPSDDFNCGMAGEPSLRSRRLAVRQKPDHPSLLQIADDAGVPLVSSPGPIINADNPQRV